MFLLDTNLVSELRRPDRAQTSVLAWSRSHDGTEFFLSVATVLELQYGALLLERRDPRQGSAFRAWVRDEVLPDFTDRILPITTAIALKCAELHVPNRRGERDAYIAATALVHDLTVVTRNTRDFDSTGVKLFNPWTAAS